MIEEDRPIDVRTILGTLKQLEFGDYIVGIGVGLLAFREARKRRLEEDDERYESSNGVDE